MPITLWCFNIISIILLITLRQKCLRCQQDNGQQIITALDKMGKGDLDWKISLHRDTELAGVANSVNNAQKLLAQRISRLQWKTRELTEVEDFLIDSIECSHNYQPHTLKALRKLKICLNRLKSDVDDFQLSLIPKKPDRQKHTIPL